MAEAINKQDIVKGDPLKEIAKDADVLYESLKKVDGEIRKTAQAFTDLSKVEKTTLEGISKINKANETANKLYKQTIENEKLEIKLLTEKERLKQAELRTATQYQRERERLEKQQARAIKAAENELNAYKQLERATREQKNESKRLGAELLKLEANGQRNTKVYRELSSEYRRVTTSAKAGDAQLKKLDKTVGDNYRNVGLYERGVRGLNKTLGALGVAFGARQIVGGFTSVIVDFNQAQTDLAAISGKTAEELEPLTAQAKELGATTQFTATEITNLQIELAKLGFTSNEILNATGGIADFAAATGVEIPRAAALGGAAVRAFGLEASDIDRVVSVLGVSTTKTALNFGFLETALSTVAPVANAFGFSIEDTTALLGQLANSGFDASSAATATRNILLNLADANGDLAKELGRPIKNSEDLAEALQELDARGIDLASSLELTDKRSVAAFNTFLKGSGDLKELTASITDVDDELKAMAEKRLDSVQGQFALLNSAIEGYILGTDEAAGISDKLKTTLGFLANNIGLIFDIIIKATGAFLTFKTTLFAIRMADRAKEWLNFRKAVKQSSDEAGRATGSIKSFGQALKGIGFTALIALAYEFATALYDIASGAHRARFEVEQLNKAREQGQKVATKVTENLQKALQKEINLINESTGSQEERDRRIDEVNKKYQKRIDQEISKLQELISKNEDLAKTEQKRVDDLEANTNRFGFSSLEQTTALETQKNVVLQVNKEIEEQKIILESLIGFNDGLNQSISDQTAAYKALNFEKSKSVEKDKEQSTLLQKLIEQRKVAKKELESLITVETSGSEQYILDKKAEIRLLNAKIEKVQFLLEIEEIGNLKVKKLESEAQKLREEGIQRSSIQIEQKKEDVKTEEELLKERYDTIIGFEEAITQALMDQIDKRIELSKKEQDAAKNAQDYLQQLAANGNIKAEQSIASEIQIQKDAIAEQERLEKRKAQLELISSGLQTYSAEIGNGKSAAEAFTSTITSTKLLADFLKNLSFFAEGTNNAPGGFAVVDEEGAEIITDKHDKIKQIGTNKGARLTKLDAGDKVITAPKTLELMSAMNIPTTKLNSDSMGNSFDLIRIEKGLKSVENAVKNNATRYNVHWDSFGNVIETRRKGGDRRTSRHRI